jgi:hypothetical protein
MRSKPKTPIFPYSITPFPSYASESISQPVSSPEWIETLSPLQFRCLFKTRHAFAADILYIDRPLFINNPGCAVSEMEASPLDA